jgi:IS1 family transposase
LGLVTVLLPRCGSSGFRCPVIIDESWSIRPRAPDFYEAYAKLFRPWQHRPSGRGSGQTSLIEGLNNKWRNRVSGLARKNVCVRYLEDLAGGLGWKTWNGDCGS